MWDVRRRGGEPDILKVYMPRNTNTLVLKQPLWKRIAILAGAIAFVVGGVYLFLVGQYLVGILCVGFFGACGIIMLLKPSLTVLTADAEGIVPTFALSKGDTTKIPWSMVDKIYVATQRVRSNTFHHLAVTLHDPNFLIKNTVTQQMRLAMNQFASFSMDDGGVAQLYIPATALPGSVVKVVEQLNAFRPTPIPKVDTPNSSSAI